jgi:hypothetical protein
MRPVQWLWNTREFTSVWLYRIFSPCSQRFGISGWIKAVTSILEILRMNHQFPKMIFGSSSKVQELQKQYWLQDRRALEADSSLVDQASQFDPVLLTTRLTLDARAFWLIDIGWATGVRQSMAGFLTIILPKGGSITLMLELACVCTQRQMCGWWDQLDVWLNHILEKYELPACLPKQKWSRWTTWPYMKAEDWCQQDAICFAKNSPTLWSLSGFIEESNPST